MHKLRGEAKHAAWYDEPDEPANFNPFRKVRTDLLGKKNALRNAENGDGGLTRSTTDQEHRHADVSNRRAEMGAAADTPQRYGTAPISGRSRTEHVPGSDSTQFEIIRTVSPKQEAPLEDSPLPLEETKDSTSGDTIAIEDTPTSEKPRQRKGLKGMFRREKKVVGSDKPEGDDLEKPHYTFGNQIRATLFNSWINVLLIAVPVGIIVNYVHITPVAIFVINFIAIIPLAALLSYATEEIALRTGEVVGGLLNASFGNAVELIVSIIALLKDEILIVQTSLIGSMLSNLLLVLGMAFFFGGLNRFEQSFNVVVAQTASSLLALAIGSLVLPTAFHSFAGDNQTAQDPEAENDVSAGSEGIAPISRGTSIILLIVYACYLFFQLKSHVEMYTKESEKAEKRDIGRGARKIRQKLKRRSSSDQARRSALQVENAKVKAEKDEVPQLHIWVAIATLAVSTVLVAFCAEFMVSSIDAITVCGSGVSKTFVGLILLPIVGNAAEHATAVTVAVKDKMDLSIGVAVGSSMQIALLVLPLIVILGWITGHDDMTLWFDGYQVVVLFISILLVNYLIQDGKSHWLEGVLLMTLYLIIALSAWYYPTKGDGACPNGQ
ncbi:hypothetical protein EPUS_01945 [Endocarpon pusillum Z07020]|uniref:Vacuolar calcium ion transporter n=1 Tax=Endocarpon pusillum (strain Z07020 / HMAS-L-300199) TaxID=1263415 RepID=U1GPM1_ENDPU|nr:uncharacterized protein EPUS_01945 [Endocarpon pusillum Z07020]ERF74258.1 hypothetical protein EPUS_01945 [Endocarpon pusillum Z07020]